jgi:hypothetical protein
MYLRGYLPVSIHAPRDSCTLTAQEATNDELMKATKIIEKSTAKVDTQELATPESKAEEASADALETTEPPKAKQRRRRVKTTAP